MGPGDLQAVLSRIKIVEDPRLLVGISASDDAGVVRLTDDIALIQTVDFFTPIVDDPFHFGAIAAANALSDVYAMGGIPLSCMNIVCFPSADLDLNILVRIIEGGYSKVMEAGAVLAGGHSIVDREIKFGMAVTGTVHPDRIVANSNARPGEILVLTKPIGTGILSTALKQEVISDAEFAPAVAVMSELNRGAAQAMIAAGVRAATDITGFGLLGHALEIAAASKIGLSIEASAVPLLERVMEQAEKGVVPGGTKRNLAYYRPSLEIPVSMSEPMLHVLCDAQTSGGLLMCVPPDKLDGLLSDLKNKGLIHAVIGKVTEDHQAKIRITA